MLEEHPWHHVHHPAASTVPLFFACWLRCMRTPEWQDDILASSSMKSLLSLLPGGSIPAWTRGLWPTGAKVMKLGSKYLAPWGQGRVSQLLLYPFAGRPGSGTVFLLWMKISRFDLFFSQRNKRINKNNRNVCIAKGDRASGCLLCFCIRSMYQRGNCISPI